MVFFIVYTIIPTVLKETAPTEEYVSPPRNTKRILVGHCLRRSLQSSTSHTLTLCQKRVVEVTGLKISEISYS